MERIENQFIFERGVVAKIRRNTIWRLTETQCDEGKRVGVKKPLKQCEVIFEHPPTRFVITSFLFSLNKHRYVI